jgi:hypothetical protein
VQAIAVKLTNGSVDDWIGPHVHRDEASKTKKPGKQLLLNDFNIIRVAQSPTTKKAAINPVSPDKECVAWMQSCTDFAIDLSTPGKKPMAGTLKSTTQKSIKAPLTKVLLNETEDAPHIC